MKGLHESDFHLWAQRQAQLLREQRFGQLDIANLSKELGHLAQQQRNELRRHAARLMRYFLKSKLAPECVSPQWLGTMARQRNRIRRALQVMPTLAPLLDDYLTEAYRHEAERLTAKARLPRNALPVAPPWSREQLLMQGFMPWDQNEKAADP